MWVWVTFEHANFHFEFRYSILMVTFSGNNFFPFLKKQDNPYFVANFGCLLMFAGGISVISLIELLLLLVQCLKTCNGAIGRIQAIFNCPRCNVDSSQFHHLARDLIDFLKMTSIHGVHYLTKTTEKKVFWSIVIVISASLGVYYVRDLIKTFSNDPVVLEISDKVWNVRDVIKLNSLFRPVLWLLFFQIPFPAVTFCPDFDRSLLDRPIDCLLKNKCEGVNRSDVLSEIHSLKAGCLACRSESDLAALENTFQLELLLTDYRNKTYIDYFQNFMDPAWSEQNSFCYEGRGEVKLQENLAWHNALCFTFNFPKEYFYENKYVWCLIRSHESKLNFSYFCSVANDFLKRNQLNVKCAEKYSTKNIGLFMNLLASKSRIPEEKKQPYPMHKSDHYNCRNDIGNIRIHQRGETSSVPTALDHSLTYSLVVTPKITESDESIRIMAPKE